MFCLQEALFNIYAIDYAVLPNARNPERKRHSVSTERYSQWKNKKIPKKPF